MVDYVRSLATAQRLIRQSGRLVGLRRASSGPADATDPLNGPAPDPAPDMSVPATFVPPSSLNMLGASTKIQKMFANSDKIAIVAPISNVNYNDYRFLIDTDNTEWIIDAIEELKPGNIALLYYIGVSLEVPSV